MEGKALQTVPLAPRLALQVAPYPATNRGCISVLPVNTVQLVQLAHDGQMASAYGRLNDHTLANNAKGEQQDSALKV